MNRVQEAEFAITQQAMMGLNSKDDERLRVTFDMYPSLDQEASAQQGRPIYKDELYVTIIVPGERDIVHRKAWEKDFARFPQQLAAFRNKANQDAAVGTPLKLMTWLTIGQVKELEYFNCVTVEQLANMPDSTASRFMGIQKLKQLAKDYLQAAKETAPLTAMRAELDKRDNELETANRNLAEQAERIKALEEGLKKLNLKKDER